MGDLTEHITSKAYIDDCGIWPMPTRSNYWSKVAMLLLLVNYLILLRNFTMGGIGQIPQYSS
jgi:hypothetical protein